MSGKVTDCIFDLGNVFLNTRKVSGPAGFGAIAGLLPIDRNANPSNRMQGCFSNNLLRKLPNKTIKHTRPYYAYYKNNKYSAGPLFGIYTNTGSFYLNQPAETSDVDKNNQQIIVGEDVNLQNDYAHQQITMEYETVGLPDTSKNQHIFKSDDSYRIYWNTKMPIYYMRHYVNSTGRHFISNKYKSLYPLGENVPTIAFNFSSKEINSINNRIDYTILEYNTSSDPNYGGECQYVIPLDKSVVLMRDLDDYVSEINVLNTDRKKVYDKTNNVNFEINFAENNTQFKTDFGDLIKLNLELESANAGVRKFQLKSTASKDEYSLFIKNDEGKLLFTLSHSKLATLFNNDNAKLTIEPKKITALTFDEDKIVKEKVYDGTDEVTINGEMPITPSDIIAGDTVVINVESKKYSDKTANDSKTITITFSISGTDGANYILDELIKTKTFQGKITKANIDLNSIDVTGIVLDRQYDGTNNFDIQNAIVTGVIGIVDADATLKVVVKTAQSSDKNIEDNKIVTITFKLSDETALENYVLPEKTITKIGKITKKVINYDNSKIALDNTSKVYDKTNDYNGVITLNKENLGIVNGENADINVKTKNYDNSNAGSHNIVIVLELVGNDKGNYELSNYVFNFSGTITKKVIENITYDNAYLITKVYDGNDDALINSEGSITSSDIISNEVNIKVDAKYDTKDISAKTINFTNIRLDGNSEICANYELKDNISIHSISATITKIIVTINEDELNCLENTKQYDGTTSLQLQNAIQIPEIKNKVDNEDVNFIVSAVYNSKNVADANKIIATFELSGTDIVNYKIANALSDGKFVHEFDNVTITKRIVTIDSNNLVGFKNQKYNGTATYSITNETITVPSGGVLNEEIACEFVGANFESANYILDNKLNVTVKLVDNEVNKNYMFNNNTSQISLVLDDIKVDKAIISVEETSEYFNISKKVYDGNTLFSANKINVNKFNGKINSDDVNVIVCEGESYKPRLDNKDAEKSVNIKFYIELSGSSSQNYELEKQEINITGVYVERKSLSLINTSSIISAVTLSKIYDATNTVSIISSSSVLLADGELLSGDQEILTIASAEYDSKDAGSRTISLRFTMSDNTGNYTWDQSRVISYSDNVEITKKPIRNYSHTNLFDTTVVYTGSNDAPQKAGGKIVSADVYDIDKDKVTFTLLSATYGNKNAGTNRSINVVLNDFADTTNNYIQEVKTFTVNNITITKKQIADTNAADAITKEKVYDGTVNANINSSFNITSGDVVSGDNIKFRITSATYDNKNTSDNKTINITIEIDPSSTSIENYELSSNTASISNAKITQKPISITKDMLNIKTAKQYDGNTNLAENITLKVDLSSLLESVDINIVSFTFTANYDSSEVGDRNITVNIAINDANNNYSLVTTKLENIQGRITEYILTVEVQDILDLISNLDKEFDNTNVLNSNLIIPNDKIEGIKPGYTNISVIANITYADKLVGKHQLNADITINGSDKGKYSLDNTNLIIGEGNILVKNLSPSSSWFTFNDTEKVYDGLDTYNGLVTIASDFGQVAGDTDISLVVKSKKYSDRYASTNKTINLTLDLEGAHSNCYNLTTKSFDYTDESNVINKKNLIIKDNAINIVSEKEYDGQNGIQASLNIDNIEGIVDVDKNNNENISIHLSTMLDNVNVSSANAIFEFIINGFASDSYNLDKSQITNRVVNIYPKQITYNKNYITFDTTKIYNGNNIVNNVEIKEYSGVLDSDKDAIVLNLFATAQKDSSDLKKDVTVSITISGIKSTNYTFANDKTMLNNKVEVFESSILISKIKVFVSAQDLGVVSKVKSYDKTKNINNNTCYVKDEFINKIPSENVSINILASYDNAKVGEAKLINYEISLSGLDKGNYEIDENSVKMTNDGIINKIELTLSDVSNISYVKVKTYDGNTNISTEIEATAIYANNLLISLLDNEDIKLLATLIFDDKNAGDNKEYSLTIELDGLDKDNYKIINPIKDARYSDGKIDKLELNISNSSNIAYAKNKIYDGKVQLISNIDKNTIINNNILEDLITIDDIDLQAIVLFNDKNVGENKEYQLSINLDGLDKGNYIIKNPIIKELHNDGKISKRTTTFVSLDKIPFNRIKEYDGNTNSETIISTNIIYDNNILGNLVENDDVKLNVFAIFNDKNVGENKEYQLSIILDGLDKDNYDIQNPIVSRHMYDGQITKRNINFVNKDKIIYTKSKVYDANLDIVTMIDSQTIYNANLLENIVDSEDVQLKIIVIFDDKNVGDNKKYKLNVYLLGHSSANYNITNPIIDETYENGNIAKKDILLTDAMLNIINPSKVYDTTVDFKGNIEADNVNFIVSDEVLLDFSTKYNSPNVSRDKKLIVYASIKGQDANNYNLINNYFELSNSELEISKLNVNVVINQKLIVSSEDKINKELLISNMIFKNDSGDEIIFDKNKIDIEYKKTLLSDNKFAVELTKLKLDGYDADSYSYEAKQLNGLNEIISINKVKFDSSKNNNSTKLIIIFAGVVAPLLLLSIFFAVVISKKKKRCKNC